MNVFKNIISLGICGLLLTVTSTSQANDGGDQEPGAISNAPRGVVVLKDQDGNVAKVLKIEADKQDFQNENEVKEFIDSNLMAEDGNVNADLEIRNFIDRSRDDSARESDRDDASQSNWIVYPRHCGWGRYNYRPYYYPRPTYYYGWSWYFYWYW